MSNLVIKSSGMAGATSKPVNTEFLSFRERHDERELWARIAAN